jgi:alpha-galactosidase
LKELVPPTGIPATFEDEHLLIGTVRLPNKTMLCLFNWFDTPQTMWAALERPAVVTDFWTGESLGRRDYHGIEVKDMPPHSARILVCDHG